MVNANIFYFSAPHFRKYCASSITIQQIYKYLHPGRKYQDQSGKSTVKHDLTQNHRHKDFHKYNQREIKINATKSIAFQEERFE